jgi:hypothetical protein
MMILKDTYVNFERIKWWYVSLLIRSNTIYYDSQKVIVTFMLYTLSV